MNNNKINFTPLITDIALLFVIFFIAVIILQQVILQDTEEVINLQADTFFEKLEYELDSTKKTDLKKELFYSDFKENIIDKFKENRLERIIITGYADTTQPKFNSNRNWQTNRELSFLRANVVCDIFIELAKDSFNFSNNELKNFKRKLLPAGYGEFNPLIIGEDICKEPMEKYEGEFEYSLLNKIKDKCQDPPEYGTELDFIKWEDNQNRRIEIKTIYK